MLSDAGVYYLVKPELVCKSMLLNNTGTGAAVYAGVCCWVMLQLALLVCCKFDWLLRCRHVVSAEGCKQGDQR